MKKSHVLLFLILANVFWAGNYVVGQFVVQEMTPLEMTFIRWAIAIFLLFPLAHWIEKPDWKSVWKQWKLLAILGILGILGYNFTLYWALQYTTAMNASLVNSMNPALIFLFSAFLLKERVSLLKGAGICISLIGVLLVLTKGSLLQILHLDFNQGDLLMLIAITIWTFYSIIGRKMKNTPPVSATAVSAFIAVLFLLPFVLTSGMSFHWSGQAGAGILYIAIFPSVCSFVFWNISLRSIEASQAGVYLNLIAVFTAVLTLLLGQHITAFQVIGGLLVFIGVYLTSKPEAKKVPHSFTQTG
ncbi:DMT family transporter [Bacillus massiliglaciei]|uniref:DMT family transporter n=1 Tax=Bacillus massiliglaciei TaxID=1816693 RepID=UPI000AC2094D|nr:DMT family transporter [Bacillus massiliglaciei]